MSLSNVISTIATHLAKQRGRALTVNGANAGDCLYRGANGSMCAVGCLIPDEMYHTDLEGLTASDFFDSQLFEQEIGNHFRSLVPESERVQLISLLEISQAFHDSAELSTSLLASVSSRAHFHCKAKERNSGEELYDWDALTANYKELLVKYSEASDEELATEIVRRLSYILAVVVEGDPA